MQQTLSADAIPLQHGLAIPLLTEFASVERVMIRENVQGSTWASVVAVLAVTCAIGVLYLPLILG
jgi:hypothetical protein